MNKYSLNGSWIMTRVQTQESFEATVPSDNFTELLKLNVIPDPYYKDNEKDVEWVGREDWAFSRSFTLSKEDLLKKHIVLECLSLDTVCDVFINGVLVGQGKNAHLKYEFDVKGAVKEGENKIEVLFYAPVTLADKLQAEKPLPKNYNGTDGIAYIRKPHCHFGWDWGPHIPISGITNDINIICYDSRLKDFDVKQEHSNGTVTISVKLSKEGEGECSLKVLAPSGEVIPFIDGKAVILRPELWWTKELSGRESQPLYTVVVTFDGVESVKKIGLRTIKLNRNYDKYGSNFCFELNGVPIFGKGANWILPDSVMGRVKNETYDYYIDSALNAHFNMLRIWGGAYYGSDYFYSKCDEKGLLLWQDCMFACLMYPLYEDDFVQNVLDEIEYNVKRIKHHPSLMLWCGNNEIEESNLHLPPTNKLMQSYKQFFYGTLKDKIRSLDPDTPYIPTSPVGEDFHKSVTNDEHGDTHMWTVWHGQKPLNYYRKRLTRFCSEFGMESLPSLDAIRQFARAEDYSITSDIFNSHQKCLNGNRKMLYYLLERFYEPERFEDLIYMTQLTQKECISDATEHWRRNRGRCNGSVYWQYNDCWQAPSWSSVDYSGKWKALMYASRHFFEPVCVSVEDSGTGYSVCAINDLREPKKLKIRISEQTLDGKTLFEKEIEKDLKPLSSEPIFSYNIKGNKHTTFLSIKAWEGERLISERTKIFTRDRDLRLKKPRMEKATEYRNGELKITLKSDTFARSVMVDIVGLKEALSDNYFDLLPNEEKVITVKTDKPYGVEDVQIKTLADVPVKKSKWAVIKYRTKFFFEPKNLQMWYWYTLK